jgi:signal transduction histidine kinase/ligand-binding sensor domain-containing protein
MGKPHGQGRYAALRLAVAGLRTVQLSILLAGVLLACGPGAQALDPALDVSQYAHTAWKIHDGFSKGIINAIAQTPDGYLWLGTEFGLLRFDGVRVVSWQPPPGQHLPSDFIASLLVTRDGTLWIGTLKGLASWRDGRLTRYPELAGGFVNAIVEDHKGTVWASAGAATGGKLCAIGNGNVQCYEGDGTFGSVVFNLYEDSKGNLWAAVEGGLWRWRPGPPKFYPLARQPNGIQALGEDADGTMLVGWKGGIYRFVDGKTEAYPLPGPVHQFRAHGIFRDHDGGLWIGAQSQGLLHVHQGRSDMFSLSDGLSGDVVAALFQDREGEVWVATNGGLDRFRNFTVATFSVGQGLSQAVVSSVLADRDGSVWFTDGAVQRWNNGQILTYGEGDKKLSGRAPHSLFQDSRGRIWVSTLDRVGYLENGGIVSVPGIPGMVRGLAEDGAGNLWIATLNSGLFRLSARSEVQQTPWTDLGRKDFPTALALDPSRGGLWIGFYERGIAYFRDGKVQASYGSADGLGEGAVSRFRFDADGTVWAATQGGLSRLKNGRVVTMTSKNGLPCDAVHWVIQDNDHSFWLFMPCGLVRIARSEVDAWAAAVDKEKDTKQTIRATVFDSSDGVRITGYPGGDNSRVARSSDGKLWFATNDGISVIDPRHIPFNKMPPPVHIEQITADHKTYDTSFAANGDANGHLRLPPLARDLTIDYTALSLVVSEKVFFRYKLEGWDRDWQDAGTRRQAFYTNLGPRNYRFRVVACNNSGVWNEAGTFLDFSVAPAYYQTTWFRLSFVAAFLTLLWALYQLRLRQLAREFDAGLEARVNERTRIARELHDSLLQGFQGLIFRFQAAREFLPGRPSEAMEALDIALGRADKVIVEGRDTVSDLRQPVVGDNDIGQALTALGEELAAQSGNGAAPCVRVLVEGKQRELNPILRDEIYRIAREALRNAFRHAQAQKIEAEITYSDSQFLLHVRDDGRGIDPKVTNQGARAGHWGLPGMRERAKRFGGNLEVWSEPGAGTEIELRVPGAIVYGKSEPRRRFWLRRKKIGESDGQQS